ncbi:hypothetical protein GN958_ATG12269 [Phytophthora infestans]|uniref:Uncharacterized protein n=1 Tax=Phytophthora infestans TaxID=4787 RepID=A0A8S9UGH9_PHYIN|nr:hypothetical protein GN958_ATG12269 [Phytophthora infestans]
MVFSRRAASPTSSLSSYGISCEYQQVCKVAPADGHKDTEPVSADDDREVARRALADLEELYFDEDSDEESLDEDEHEVNSEWGSGTSPCSSRGKRHAGAMTLEELTVAVNAAIEYHRPTSTAVAQPAIAPKGKEDDKSSRYSAERCPPSHCRHQQKAVSSVSSSGEDSVLKMFQDMLEMKEKHFYALKARDNQSKEDITNRTAKVDQQQQTTTYVRDQATETDRYSHRRPLDAAFRVAELDIPPLSPSLGVHAEYDATASNLVRPIEVGPTLADLAQRRRLSSQLQLSSESSWSSSSSSSATGPGSQSSLVSGNSSGSANSNRYSATKSVTSQQTHSRRRSRTAPPSTSRASSKHSSCKSQYLAKREPSIEIREPSDAQTTPAQKDQADKGFPHVPTDQVQSGPELVKWELDLSNFAI